MPRSYKICSPYLPPAARATRAPSSDQVAVNERVDNVRVFPLPLGPGRVAAAVERLKLWENGRTLRVRFLDGDPAVQTKVEAIAKEWETEANLSLRFVTSGAAEIRVSFAEKGFSWSTAGGERVGADRRPGEPLLREGHADLGGAGGDEPQR